MEITKSYKVTEKILYSGLMYTLKILKNITLYMEMFKKNFSNIA